MQGRFVRIDDEDVCRCSIKLDERLRTDGGRFVLGERESRVDVLSIFPFDRRFNKD